MKYLDLVGCRFPSFMCDLLKGPVVSTFINKCHVCTVVVKRQAEEVGKRASEKLRAQGNHKHKTRARLKKRARKQKARRHLNQSTVKLKIIKEPVNHIHFRYAALDSREQQLARLWDRRHALRILLVDRKSVV